jgi:hypothetical protein
MHENQSHPGYKKGVTKMAKPSEKPSPFADGSEEPHQDHTQEEVPPHQDFEKPTFALPEEDLDDQDPAEFAEGDWRREVDSEAKRVLEGLNKRFFDERREALQDASEHKVCVDPDIIQLFYNPQDLITLFRLTNGGVSWKCNEFGRNSGGKKTPSRHTDWQLLGHASPEGAYKVPVLCMRSEGKSKEPILEFKVL